MLCDQNALHLKTPFELHTHKVCSLQRRKGKNSVIILYTFLAEVYPNYMRLDHNSHHALSLELNSPINAFHVTAIMSCKRYTDRGSSSHLGNTACLWERIRHSEKNRLALSPSVQTCSSIA